MDSSTITRLANQLHEAEKNRKVIRFLSAQYPEMTIADSYAIQRAWIDIKLKEGRRIIGHKIGLTSRAMQSMANIDEPDYGVLFDDMLYHDGSQIPANRFITPMLENELAFVLGKPLRGPNCSIFDVLSATEYVIPALEIVDLRTMRDDPETKAPRRVVDTIADNAANAALVIGGRPVRAMDVDLRWVGTLCYRNGVLEELGVAAAVWLAAGALALPETVAVKVRRKTPGTTGTSSTAQPRRGSGKHDEQRLSSHGFFPAW
jgi:2-oxo-hept-3-ene-1,7-dioate hydratase